MPVFSQALESVQSVILVYEIKEITVSTINTVEENLNVRMCGASVCSCWRMT